MVFTIPDGTSVINLTERAHQLGESVFPAQLEQWRKERTFSKSHTESERVKLQVSEEHFAGLTKLKQIELARREKHSLASEWQLAAAILLNLVATRTDLCRGKHARTSGNTLNVSLSGLKSSFYTDEAASGDITAAIVL